MNKKSLIAGALIVVALLAVSASMAKTVHAPTAEDVIYPRASVTIGGKAFKTLVAATEELRDKGLGLRDSLPADEAMLFVFDAPDLLGFWMKDMRFSIDMLWLDIDGTVVSMEKSVSPATYPKVFFPTRPALYVVETNAGVLESLGVKIGDKVSIAQR
jgi:uncharacterized membrane protein (UPF0127 family)